MHSYVCILTKFSTVTWFFSTLCSPKGKVLSISFFHPYDSFSYLHRCCSSLSWLPCCLEKQQHNTYPCCLQPSSKWKIPSPGSEGEVIHLDKVLQVLFGALKKKKKKREIHTQGNPSWSQLFANFLHLFLFMLLWTCKICISSRSGIPQLSKLISDVIELECTILSEKHASHIKQHLVLFLHP